ncbi:MAG: mechanosensitive ion channel [Oligosphaeraceae bacterium]|nr:mechanosensitive ion channel [Oligosphaeraceae bacterium]
MGEVFDKVWGIIVDSNALNLVYGIAVLIIGWFLAIYASGLARRLVRGSALNKKLSCCPAEGDGDAPKCSTKLEDCIGKGVFVLVLLFTIMSCLTVLNLTQAAAPIQRFFDNILAYAANLIGAGILAALAWFCASGVKYLSAKAMRTTQLDQKLAKTLDKESGKPISTSASEVIYWLVLLFFLPAILRSLKIGGITEPLQLMLAKILEYIPNLVAAGAILFIGLWAAKIVRKTVSGLVVISSLDNLGEKAGVSKLFGNQGLSGMIGVVAYVLIAIPVLISSLNALQIDSLSESVAGLFDKILNAAGDLIGAALLVFVAVLVGRFVANLVQQLLENFGFNKLLAHLGVGKEDKDSNTSPAALVGKIVFVAIILNAAIAACDIMAFPNIAALIQIFLVFGGNILVGLVVLLIGMWLANLVSEFLQGKCNKLVVGLVRGCVLVFTGAIAIHNMEIGGPIVQTAFTLLLGAVCVAIALAFGLGGREFAARKYEEWSAKIEKKD